jgi:hypothetical protein
MELVNPERPLRLTVGEIAFAVAQLHSYEKAVKLVSMQFDVERIDDALIMIQASAQSLHARELATQLAPRVELTPPLVTIGKVLGSSEWMLRCTRTNPGGETDALLLHFSPSGVLAHEVVSEHVQRLAPLRDLGALLGRAAELFQLSHVESPLPSLRLARDAFDAIWASSDAQAIEAMVDQTRAPGAAGLIRSGLAGDLASPLWKGGISRTHYPPGGELEVGACLYLAAGQRTWLLVPDSPVSILVTEATRQRFADAAVQVVERVPAADRVFTSG